MYSRKTVQRRVLNEVFQVIGILCLFTVVALTIALIPAGCERVSVPDAGAPVPSDAGVSPVAAPHAVAPDAGAVAPPAAPVDAGARSSRRPSVETDASEITIVSTR